MSFGYVSFGVLSLGLMSFGVMSFGILSVYLYIREAEVNPQICTLCLRYSHLQVRKVVLHIEEIYHIGGSITY